MAWGAFPEVLSFLDPVTGFIFNNTKALSGNEAVVILQRVFTLIPARIGFQQGERCGSHSSPLALWSAEIKKQHEPAPIVLAQRLEKPHLTGVH